MDGGAVAATLRSRLEPVHGALAPPAAPPHLSLAAVVVPLLIGADGVADLADLDLLFTVRPSDLRKHAGEVAFPGGRFDAADENLLATALRECEEEVGIPAAELEVVGALPLQMTMATNYLVRPFVALVDAERLQLTPSAGEVAALFTLPLGELPARRQTVAVTRRGITFRTEAFVVSPHQVWGLTYRITCELLRRLSLLEPTS